MSNQQAPVGADVVYAGFWRRAGAFVLDSVILTIGFYLIVAIVAVFIVVGVGDGGVAEQAPAWFALAYLAAGLGWFVAAALYYALQESSAHQASVGKRAVGIKVTDQHGQRLSFGGALGRWAAAALSYLTLYIGFLMAAFTPQKQALHDMAAGTLVVDRWAYTETPERQQRHIGALAVILALVLLAVPIMGILAAIAIPAYQDYTMRARAATALVQAGALQEPVRQFVEANDRCPEAGDGFAAENATGSYDAEVKVLRLHSGSCGIQARFPASAGSALDGRHLWLELGSDGEWTCTGDLKPAHLPSRCR
ncbi:MAG: RDD family protein [Pseudomonadota bacterium]|nr:RDD family protein [Pseudomonadota bacterium]